MEDAETTNGGASPASIIPQKRTLEDEAPVNGSVMVGGDTNGPKARAPVKEKTPVHREQREKKESLKKRESMTVPASSSSYLKGSVDGSSPARTVQGSKGQASKSAPGLAPLRYKLAAPVPLDYQAPKPPVHTFNHRRGSAEERETDFFETSEHVYNRKGFRYTPCVADPRFPSSFYYRQSEAEPFAPRINYEDSSSHIMMDGSAKQITTYKGFRMARANVGAREGRWFWECKITSGIRPEGHHPQQGDGAQDGGHVRIGWARREASLDAPVGFDCYSYGIRDVSGQRMHMSRPKDFSPAGEDIREGDVIGLEIKLPSLAIHRKVVEGQYNPAADVNDSAAAQDVEPPDIIRDRVPIRYRSNLYFEQFEYHSTKELEERMNPTPAPNNTSTAASARDASNQEPNPFHPQPSLRTLPNSSIKVYKNGQLIGEPYKDLLVFLPPASRPQAQVGARDGLDDGMLGYFPAISVFRGGAAEANFGPDFWYSPPDIISSRSAELRTDDRGPNTSRGLNDLRAIGERYVEQISEDITYDLIDEADFWVQDGGSTVQKRGVSDAAPTVLGPVDPDAMEVEQAMPATIETASGERGIKEIVQEDE